MSEVPLPFIGSEVLSTGRISRHRLRSDFIRLCPNVYARPGELSLAERIHAAWLWSDRRAVIAGAAAAALHGSAWVDHYAPVELIHTNPRAPDGVITRRDRLLDGEVRRFGDMLVTTVQRTAFDIGRRGSLSSAVGRIDALFNATGLSKDSVLQLADRHRRTRGLRQLETVLDLADAGAQSPKESWLRLVLVRAGLPRPLTQIPVLGADGYAIAYLDLGWPDLMIAVEYDGDHHRSDRRQYVKDIRRREVLERMGWIVITVVAEDRPFDIVRRVSEAFARRLSVR